MRQGRGLATRPHINHFSYSQTQLVIIIDQTNKKSVCTAAETEKMRSLTLHTHDTTSLPLGSRVITRNPDDMV